MGSVDGCRRYHESSTHPAGPPRPGQGGVPDRAALVELGVTIGVTIESARPKLLVNLEASKPEGLDLTSQMLQLAEVIK